VLDIGTGTGLLSMMAVRSGADQVTACETFKPMIQVAKKCIEANGMQNKIKIIEKHSTDISIGEDMPERANVLVAEVFDTELIGEGAIRTFKHALDNLLVKDCYVIPDNATIHVQVVESSMLYKMNWLNLDKYHIKIPQEYMTLAGDAILDVQMDQLNEFKLLSESIDAFKYEIIKL
jgi:type III protein arginine methyltransferase